MIVGESVYGEKCVAVQVIVLLFFFGRHLILVWCLLDSYCVLDAIFQNEDGTKAEYRVWNPFRSKLAAAILGAVDRI